MSEKSFLNVRKKRSPSWLESELSSAMWERLSYITFPKHVAIDNARLKLVYCLLLLTCGAMNVWRLIANKQLTSTVPLEVIPRLRGVSDVNHAHGMGYISDVNFEHVRTEMKRLCGNHEPTRTTFIGMDWTRNISCPQMCEKFNGTQKTQNCVFWISLVEESTWERMLVTTSVTRYTLNSELPREAATKLYPFFFFL